MSVISENLIHFLARTDKDYPDKQLDVFKLIIKNGLRTGQVQIKFAEGASIFNQIICFTDIPLRDCNEHTSIYGKFGIGFKKSYVKNAGGNPARYFLDYIPGMTIEDSVVESRGALYYNLCFQFKFMDALNKHINSDPTFALYDRDGKILISNETIKEHISSMILTYSFEKEMGDLGPARDDTNAIDLYYKEREWRLVPSGLSLNSGSSIQETGTNNYFYKFRRDDINMVVVPNEEMRMKVLTYLCELQNEKDHRLREFGLNLLPIIHYDDLQKW